MPLQDRWTRAPELCTERLVLRQHLKTDIDAMHEMWTHPAAGGQIVATTPSKADTWKRLLQYSGLWPLLGFGYWAIELRDTGRFIGEAGLARFSRGVSAEFDAWPEAGWILSSSFHRQGFAKEALTAIMSWSDSSRKLDKTVALIEPRNSASLRLARELGYVPSDGQPANQNTLCFCRKRSAECC